MDLGTFTLKPCHPRVIDLRYCGVHQEVWADG